MLDIVQNVEWGGVNRDLKYISIHAIRLKYIFVGVGFDPVRKET